MKPRNDDFEQRRQHIQELTDVELKKCFFKLTNEIVNPLLTLAHKHTTKAIERSVLLRMGFSSIQAAQVVDRLNEHQLLRKGAGHCVYRLAKDKQVSILEAGDLILSEDGLKYLVEVFT